MDMVHPSNENGKQKDRAGYPQRQPFFAHRVVRLLTKTCAAQEIGPEGCWLVSIIVFVEDAKHYSGPVLFFNGQLAPLCGFASIDRLIRSREKTVSAGWLHYKAGGKGVAGCYWVKVPPQYSLFSDTATDESSDLPLVSTRKTRVQAECKPTANRLQTPNIHTYTPNPVFCSELASTPTSEPDAPAPGFDSFECVGSVKVWTLPAAKLAEWQSSFPDLDVPAEIRKSRQWLIDNPEKRKTARGMVRFLSGWIQRSQNAGRGAKRVNGKPAAQPSIYKPLTPIV